ncbi:MAG: amino acid-binding protein [Candidatus Makaraimicrobium thalassicum]|nr:MAG: amino acid-binding protein [Candidatus Omnitrophota bacterium]
MRVSMNLELKDIPGQLVLALQPISEIKGNILSVVHHHDERTPRGTIPVHVLFELNKDKLDELIEQLEKNGVLVARVGEKRLHEEMSVMLIGHIVHTDIRDTIDAVDSTGCAEIVNLALSMPEIKQVSSAFMMIHASSKENLMSALDILHKTADEKGLLMIEPIKNAI